MAEPREINAYEKYDDPFTDAALFDFRPTARPADEPDPVVEGLEDTDASDVNPGPTADDLKKIEAEGGESPKETGSPVSS